MVGGLFTISFAGNGRSAPRRTSPSLRRAAPLASEYVGDGNNALVDVAAQDVLRPQSQFSPISFVGGRGLGKTMLACGLATRLRATSEPRDVFLYTGSDFSRAVGYATETNGLSDFRRRLHAAAALVIDDLQQLAARQPPQEELLYALDALQAEGRPVVVTLSHPPLEVPELLAPLAGRLAGGLIVPLAVPGVVARRELVNRLSRQLSLELPADAAEMLAENLTGPTVPQLYETLEQLRELQSQQPLDLTIVHRCLEEQVCQRQPELAAISAAVARYFSQPVADLHGPARRKELVQARGIAMYLARQLTGKSFSQLGKHFGNRDHTTVLHAFRKTERLLQQDLSLRKAVEELTLQWGQS